MSNWWGTAWTEKMERLAEPKRFAEGEQLARAGYVKSETFNGRAIVARVTGPTEPPITVRISIDPFSAEQWGRLLAEVRDHGRLAKELEAGRLPLEINTAYSRAKLRFMPERHVDLRLECPCPDWLKPCRHLVAAWMKFARDIERDPFLVFELRGLNRNDLLALLEQGQLAVVADERVEEELPSVEVPVMPERLPPDPRTFWSAPPLPPPFAESVDRAAPDEDVFERLRDWPKIEARFSRVYDAVYELATQLRR